MMMEGEKKRFALLLAAKDSEHVKKVYGGYFHLFVDAFGDEGEGERWDLFRVVEGEFPDMDELQNYHGFVVSGSPYDAYGNDHWIIKLCFLLKTLVAMQKKVLGVCFGHQVLCRALGGRVGRAYGGWDIGVRKVRISKEFLQFGFTSNNSNGEEEEEEEDGDEIEIPPILSIIECHQDEVLEVPEGAEIVAFSDRTGVEMFAIGDNVLGIQGHPEYNKDILDYLIDRLVSTDLIERGFAEEAKMRLQETEPDRRYWDRICKWFLKGNIY